MIKIIEFFFMYIQKLFYLDFKFYFRQQKFKFMNNNEFKKNMYMPKNLP